MLIIEDLLRPEIFDVTGKLRDLGLIRQVMLTGDSKKTARLIASKAGFDDFRAEVMPEDKAHFVKHEQANGHQVVMIDDGVNDAPALGLADVGVVVSDGAAIAREVADVIVSSGNLDDLIRTRKLAQNLEARMRGNYRKIVSINSGIMLLGALGILAPGTASLIHNTSTLIISLLSMTPLLIEEEREAHRCLTTESADDSLPFDSESIPVSLKIA